MSQGRDPFCFHCGFVAVTNMNCKWRRRAFTLMPCTPQKTCFNIHY